MTSFFILKTDAETFGHLNGAQFTRIATMCELAGVGYTGHYINIETGEHRTTNR